MLALELHRDACLAKEPALCFALARAQQELDRVAGLELHVGGLHDDAHGALAENGVDPVLSVDQLADLHRNPRRHRVLVTTREAGAAASKGQLSATRNPTMRRSVTVGTVVTALGPPGSTSE